MDGHLGFGMISVGYALTVLWMANRNLPEWRPMRAMAWIGRYSYSIYLWHPAVKAFLGYYEGRHHLLTLPLYVIGCVGIGRLAAYLIETPFLEIRDKLYPAVQALLTDGQSGSEFQNCPVGRAILS